MDEYYAAIRRLPGFLRRPLEDLSSRQAQTIHEIHLRSGRPVVLTCAGGQFCLPGQGAGQGGPALTHAQLQECFYSLCEHSVHSYEQQLARGFFTLPGGHRVGVAGLFHMQGQAMKGLCTVTSLNIRIARTVTGELPAPLRDHLLGPFRGLVLVGPPGSGKTTLLRGVSALLSRAGKKVAVVDERMEIWPCGPGGFAAPVPMHCDVLSGCDKREGILSALRSLGPQVILCDELGDENDPDVYGALARRYLNIGCSCMTPNPNRFDLLGRMIEEYKPDAVVEIVLQACHTYSVESLKVKRFVQSNYNLPYLKVETDYSTSDIGQINTRVSALIEML